MSIRVALPAITAALLFGASTPLAKLLVGDVPPLLLAGLLYLGSGLGLSIVLALRWARGQARTQLGIPRAEVPWLLGAIVFGGMLGPALLMFGLTQISGAAASLLLNVEGVLTAAIAWLVFRENTDRRIVLGMLAIVAGGALLSWEPGGANFSAGAAMPAASTTVASLLVGFFGYGLSLTLFVVGLRVLGTARTGAYFSVAPLFGVVLSLALWPSVPDPLFWVAAVLMALGVWLHVRERHLHEHTHEPLEHSQRHRHDRHHRHEHAFTWNGEEPHVHPHRHEVLTHRHPHFPDIHHRHSHSH